VLIHSGIARFLPSVQRLTLGGWAFLRYYSDRLLSAPYAELCDLAAFQDPQGPDGINLALPAPHFDLLSSGSTKLPADRRGWPPPWGLPELREVVAEKLRVENHLAVSPLDEVLITHGVTGGFSVALDAFVNRGDRVVLFDPTSPLYPFALKPRRVRIRWVPTWMEDGRTRFRFEHLARMLPGARMLVLTSPNNPTGGILSAEDLEQIAWWAERHDVLIFSDEVFGRYHYETEPLSIATFTKARQRTLVAGGVSKGYALASARIGWLAGVRHLIRPCALAGLLHTPFVPTLCQQIALAALRQGEEVFQPIKAEFESRRRYVAERLQAMGLRPVWPVGAFFFWIPVRELGLSGRAFVEHLLREKKVLVSPGALFGPSGADFIRLSYAGEDGRLREGLSRLAEFVRGPRTGLPRKDHETSDPREKCYKKQEELQIEEKTGGSLRVLA
jgi:aspartate/methionine/tyrosine aminotransferase